MIRSMIPNGGWFPRLRLYNGATFCDDDGDREGIQVELIWGRWMLVFAIARILPDIGA